MVSEQARARELMASPHTASRMSLTIADGIEQRVHFQERKRQRNLASVVQGAAEELGGEEVPNHEPDHDWTARFFGEVQDISSDEMQLLWAKVLAGEVSSPGTTSIKTLSILKNIDAEVAAAFEILCSATITVIIEDSVIVDSRVPSLGGNAGNDALRPYGLGYGVLNLLCEYGLIMSNYHSFWNYAMCAHVPGDHSVHVRIPFRFQNRYWALEPRGDRDYPTEFLIHGVVLTRAGQELSRVVNAVPNDQFARDLRRFVDRNDLRMLQVESGILQVFSPVST